MRAVLLLLGSAAVLSAEGPAAELMTVKVGTLPIILTAPHDGTLAVPGVPARKGEGVAKFVTARDTGSAALAERLAAAIEKRLGGRPHVIVAHFGRRFIDANREAAGAYEAEKARPVYDAYHAAIEDARKRVVKEFGRGLLLDIHGQGAERDTIFRGTANGKTAAHLLGRFGKGALTGPKGLFGALEKKGVKVHPACASDEKEDRRFSGGYTVQRHGSRDGGTVDAIQLEMGGDHRSAKGRAEAAARLAEAVEVFAREYLPLKKKGP